MTTTHMIIILLSHDYLLLLYNNNFFVRNMFVKYLSKVKKLYESMYSNYFNDIMIMQCLF